MATTITTDINYMKITAWVYWQVIEKASGWGFLNVEFEGKLEITQLWNKYYVFAIFSRFIKAGMYIFQSDDENTIYAYDRETHNLEIVTALY